MAEVSSPGLDQAAVVALIAAAVPQPGSAMPPGVADTGATGTAVPYARADHTHASKVRKQRVTGVNAATYTWVYPTPFAAGVAPIVQAIAEDPSNAAGDSYNVQAVGQPTATQAQFRIIRTSTGLLSLLTGALSINTTPGNINLHLLALEP
jgi:hypothetical protein